MNGSVQPTKTSRTNSRLRYCQQMLEKFSLLLSSRFLGKSDIVFVSFFLRLRRALPEEKVTAPRKARTSIAGVWTRPQALSIDSVIISPRVLWEVDTPTECDSDDDSLENFSKLP